MRILIVDDDMVTVDAVVNSVDWEKLDIEAVYTAYSIQAAKEILLEHKIEIVLSDIEMPGGNGLDLLQWFREQRQEGEFLLLTCHEKFDYAVNAVKMKATEYLLKPFDTAEVEAALQNCVTNVRIRQNDQKDKEWLHYNLENVRRAFLEQLLKEEFSEKLFESSARTGDRKLCLEKGKAYRMLVSRNTDIRPAAGEYGSRVLRFILMNIQAESLFGEPRIERTVCFEENGELVTVIFCEDQEEEELEKAGRRLQKNCEEYLKAAVTLCISPACMVEQFHDTYRQMAECVFSNISVYGKVFFIASVKAQEKAEIILRDKEKLKELLETRQKSGFLNQLKKEVSKANIEGGLSSQALASFRQEILQMVYSYLTERGISASRLLGNAVSAELERKAMRSALDMIRWVSYLLEQTYAYEEEVRNSQSIIGKIQEYIHQHYMERIGRNEIAEEFFLAPEYLAKMYKRKTGVSLKDYINEYRIQQAKRLLGEGRMVSEAAMEVGFDNFSYFSTLFRKYTGISPNAYKKM